ncbi:MAG: O-antigen ligase family protein [Bacteroidia bacterium]
MNTKIAVPHPWMNYLLMALLAMMPLVYNESGVDPNLIPRFALISVYVVVAAIYLLVYHKKHQTHYHCLVLLPFVVLVGVYWYSVLHATNQTEAVFVATKISLYTAVVVVTYLLYVNQTISFKYVVYGLITACLITVVLVLKDIYLLNKLLINLWESDNVYKINATFGHKNLLSSYLLFTLPFLVIGIKNQTKIIVKVLLILLALVVLVLLLFLQTRASLLALVIGVIFYAVLLFKNYTKQHQTNRLLLPILLVLGMLFFTGSIYIFRDKFSVITRTESFKERAALWQNSWEMFKAYPMGVGAGNWQIMLPKYGVQKFYEFNYRVTEGLTTFQRPHNDFLWVLCETGFIGGITYVLIFVLVLMALLKIKPHDAYFDGNILAAFVVSYMVVALVDFPLERIEHSFIFLMVAAITLASVKFGKELIIPIKPVLLGVLCMALFGLYAAKLRWNSELQLHKMYKAHQTQNWNALINTSVKANNSMLNMDYFSIPVSWYTGVAYFSSGDLPMAKKFFEEAYQTNPYQIHVLNNLGVCYTKEQNYQLGLPLLEQANIISPTFSDGISTLAGAYYNVGRYKDAWRVIATFKYDEQNLQYITFATAIAKAYLNEEKSKLGMEQQQRINALLLNDELIKQRLKGAYNKPINYFYE